MARDKGRLDLRVDVREALAPYMDTETSYPAVTAVVQAVLPHFELAYRRGLAAADSRAGYRVVQENERLRRELEQLKKGLT